MSCSAMDRLREMTAEGFADPRQQRQIYKWLEELKLSSDGWAECIAVLIKPHQLCAQAEFVCLQVIEHYLRREFLDNRAAVAQDNVAIVRQFMSHSLQRLCTESPPSPAVRNKMALVFALVFAADFPLHWPSFMEEVFLANLDAHPSINQFFLRTLLEVDSEVVSREVPRTKVELERGALIKDSMRDLNVINAVMGAVQQTLVGGVDDKMRCFALDVYACYIEWCDVQFMVLPAVVASIRQTASCVVEEAATNALCALLRKGMPDDAKRALITSVHGQCAELWTTADMGEEQMACVAQLIDCMGEQLVNIFNAQSKGSGEGTTETLRHLQSLIPTMLTCLAHPDYNVSKEVSPMAHGYVLIVKQSTFDNIMKEHFDAILSTSMRRYRLPDDFEHGSEGDVEEEVLELRHELRPILVNLAIASPQSFIACVHQFVCPPLLGWQTAHHNDIEVALAMLYLVGEAQPPNGTALFNPLNPMTAGLMDMLSLVFTSGVTQNGHMAVALLVHDVLCRYAKFFEFTNDPSLLLHALNIFLDERGVRHGNAHVRSRAAYQFCRFVKLDKSLVCPHVEHILTHIAPLLSLRSSVPLPNEFISTDDQMFIYEATGMLIVAGRHDVNTKREYMQRLVGDLAMHFRLLIDMYGRAEGEKEKVIVGAYLRTIIGFAARTTKGFSATLTMDTCNCSDIFVGLLQTFASELRPSTRLMCDAFRQFVHRLVICLQTEMVECIGEILQVLLVLADDMKQLQDLLVLLGQVIAKYKTSLIGHIAPNVIRSIYDAVLECSTQQEAEQRERGDASLMPIEDVMYEVRSLRRAYISTITTMVTVNCFDLLGGCGDDYRTVVMESLCTLCMGVEDPTTSKASFSCLNRLIATACQLRDATVKTINPNDLVAVEHAAKQPPPSLLNDIYAKCYASWLPAMVGQRFVPVSLLAPMSPSFDMADGQCVLIVNDITALLLNATLLLGEGMFDLLAVYLADVPEVLRLKFVQNLRTTNAQNPKSLNKSMKSFFQSMQQHSHG